MTELREFYQTQGKMMNALNEHVKSSFSKREVSEMVDDKIRQEAKENEVQDLIRSGVLPPLSEQE